MNVLVVGCGRTGSRLANELDERGIDVIVLDNDINSRDRLDADFSGVFFCGDGTDPDVLKEIGCENVDAAVIVTSNDNINVMVAQLIKFEFDLEKIFVRVLDPSREKVFESFGLRTICPTRLEKNILYNLITQEETNMDSVDLNGTSIRFNVEKAPKKLVNMFCKDIPTLNTVMVFGLQKPNGKVLLYNDELVIEERDMIIYARV